MLKRSLDVLRQVKEKAGNLVWMSAEPVSWDMVPLLDEHHLLDWVIIGAASNGRRYFQPDPEHIERLLQVLDATGTPVFYKGNIKPFFRQHDLGTEELNRWREDFPVRYRSGEFIPAVLRRQRECEKHGWTRSRGIDPGAVLNQPAPTRKSLPVVTQPELFSPSPPPRVNAS